MSTRPGFEPIHLRPTAPLAERVLLPGDPGRALMLAQLLISQPKMFNHHRGLWGYTGPANTDGEPLTVQATGMGGPSAAIVLHELIQLGVRRAIRVGTCGALDPTLALGELVVASEAIAADGTSVALGADERAHPHPELLERVAAAAPGARRGPIASTDVFYEAGSERGERWRRQGAIAVEMETAALFTVGVRAGIELACLLAVSDTFDAYGRRTRIDDDALLLAAEAMGRSAAIVLTS
ncbi:MAG TPA: hypothetical protein VHU13_01055 [Solirubrobacteraceae bacterium]|nr:hypothetical protein [Solirubrobacteraceae bacterium]